MREGKPYSVMVKVLDWGLEISEIELQLRYYIHFQIHILGKDMNILRTPSYGLNSITVDFGIK